jgi:hypothetical protein
MGGKKLREKMGKIQKRPPRRDDLGDLIGGAWRRSSPAGFQAAVDGSRGRMRGESLRVSPCFLQVRGFEAEEGADRGPRVSSLSSPPEHARGT